jgi:hypothetical protein
MKYDKTDGINQMAGGIFYSSVNMAWIAPRFMDLQYTILDVRKSCINLLFESIEDLYTTIKSMEGEQY